MALLLGLPEAVALTDELSAALVASEVDAERHHLQVRRLVLPLQQHLHHLTAANKSTQV